MTKGRQTLVQHGTNFGKQFAWSERLCDQTGTFVKHATMSDSIPIARICNDRGSRGFTRGGPLDEFAKSWIFMESHQTRVGGQHGPGNQ